MMSGKHLQFGSQSLAALCIMLAAVRADGATPDITGMWNFRYAEWQGERQAPPPELTQAARDQLERERSAEATGYTWDLASMKCLPGGFPAMMLYRTPLQILAGADRIGITAESSVEPRTIYLGRPHPDPTDASWNGDSVGQWHGNILVVDTIGLNGRGHGLWNIGPAFPATSDKAHFVERIWLEKGGQLLADSITVVDPVNYARPYTVTVHYDRMPPNSPRMEAVCEVDLEAIAKVDLNVVKACDQEAARMLDPDTRYNSEENDQGQH